MTETAKETRRLFDVSAEFRIRILSEGEKWCTVRFPTDEEWCERQRRQRTIRQSIGRQKAKYAVVGIEESSLELFRQIRLDDDGPEFNAAEATKVISRLERCEVTDVVREGDKVRIEMAVPGARVSHVLKLPNQADVLAYSRASLTATEGRHGRSELRLSLEPGGELYDKIVVKTEGYAGAVPIVHKDAAVAELLAVLAEEEEDDDPLL